jgi:hypothetical protein
MVDAPFEGTTVGLAISGPYGFATTVGVGLGVGLGVGDGRDIYYLYYNYYYVI